jgi:uncharacterized protein YaiE (UPF0345 family)
VVLDLTGTGELQIYSDDPSVVFNTKTVSDTDYWIGVIEDAGGDDDDTFAIGDGTTPGANTFLTINTSGNIGIGTTILSNKLSVLGSVGIGSTAFVNGVSAPTYGLLVEANVGIGTSAPEQKLTISDNFQLGISDATRYIYFDNGTANNAGIRYDSGTDKVQVSHDGTAWGDIASGGATGWVDDGSVVRLTTAGDSVGVGTTAPASKLSIQGAIGIGSTAYTEQGAAPTYGAIIEGNVGIGTTSPEQILTISDNLQLGGADGTRYIYFDNGTANNAGIRYDSGTDKMQFSHNGTSWEDLGSGGGAWAISDANGTTYQLNTTTDVLIGGTATSSANIKLGATSTSPSFFNSSVGIGTTAPSSFLEIFGTTEQLRLSYDASNYASFVIDSNGNLTITSIL